MDIKSLVALLDKGFSKFEICKILKVCICPTKETSKNPVYSGDPIPLSDQKCNHCGGY